ncbi:MAG: YifB family Mg chelatase-like AAA ATPase [Paludibacteraceae bacterium]|nr:YifB family Mg chelatase-like AAA ATPase [Paludibacteraceae bacterium]
MLINTYSAASVGIDAVIVTVEVHATPGYDFTMVGLPDVAVKEGHERILSAIQISGIRLPQRQYTINMSPADLKKEGAAFDLTLAIGQLAATEIVHSRLLSQYLILGELSLDGHLRPVHGCLPIALAAKNNGFKGVILPAENANEAAVVDGIEVYGFEHLTDVIAFLNSEQPATPVHVDVNELLSTMAFPTDIDFADVRGQQEVRRAIEIAAAGGHNIIMIGPPGAGKSMMAKRIPTILPPMTLSEALETTKIYSVSGKLRKTPSPSAGMQTGTSAGLQNSLIVQRPFRAPHHTITDVTLVGGGNNPHPGEVSLAHNGVLFLDELAEFKRTALEVLRQPLEDGHITVARNKLSVDYPAHFMLVAAMNPCPCGHYGDVKHPCTCTPAQRHRYMSRISGPLLDRIDIQCHIDAVDYEALRQKADGEASAAIRERVIKARAIQTARFRGTSIHCNAQMPPKMVRQYCQPNAEAEQQLRMAMNLYGLSARAYDRILKVARTIADLDAVVHPEQPVSNILTAGQLLQAIQFRQLDRSDWGE